MTVTDENGTALNFTSATDAKVAEGHLFLYDGHSGSRPVAVFPPGFWTAVWKKGARG